MTGWSILAVGFGAACGAWLRWLLAMGFNLSGAGLPLGTWLANMIGGYLVGVAVALFQTYPALNPAWRLLLVTGFLGGLTTFSTMSAENIQLCLEGRLFAAIGHASAHLLGALLATYLGILTWRELFS